jgi:CDP-6-deoxy-D-xylo-4-hexulose-3-dehydrase
MEREIDHMLAENSELFFPPSNIIPLSCPSIGKEEIIDVVNVLCSSNVTMGKNVERFEREFAEYLGVKHAVMVNSGSSANLLVASSLLSKRFTRHLSKGDEIIVPVVTWPTTIFPFAQLGLIPVMIDCDDTLNIDPSKIEAAISSKTKAICIVPILGNPCDMKKVQDVCRKYNLLLIEDTCESLGSRYESKFCGTFGLAGTYSFFFSHHMTTIEGGMIVTNDDEFVDIVRCQRAHGWIRNLDAKDTYASEHSDIDPRFLFIDWGYNFRPMELQAVIGSRQLKKLDEMNRVRKNIAKTLKEYLSVYNEYIYFPTTVNGGDSTFFGFPFLIKETCPINRCEIISILENNGISTRPIVGGNLSLQPAFNLFEWRKGCEFKNADKVHSQGVYFGTHPGMTLDHCKHIFNVFSKIFR